MLMLVSITLILMQGHSGLAKVKNQYCMLSATKQAIIIQLATTVGHFFHDLDLDICKTLTSPVLFVCPSVPVMQSQGVNRKPWSCATLYRLVLTTAYAAVLLARQTTSQSSVIQTVSGTMYAENFTYYKLSGQGWLRLELHTLKGDVDLYVSGLTLHPSFAEYELKSDSCGMDVVDIHSTMKRPVGIGIYAHPFHFQSSFRLDIQVIKEVEVDEYDRLFQKFHYYTYFDGVESMRDDGKSRNKNSGSSDDSDEEVEESIWWTIIVTLIKFVLEVIL